MNGKASITIQASREELAERWQSFEREPHRESRLGPIEIAGGDAASGLRWRTAEGTSHGARGVTRFSDAPAGRGTEIHISVEYDAPAGPIGAAVLKVTGDEPLQLVRDDLRRLKQLIETGEIARSDGSPVGASAKTQPKQRPAQPVEATTA